MTDFLPCKIQITFNFGKQIKRLSKRYRSIKSDLRSTVQQIEAGELPGDRVTNIGFVVMKVRVQNSNIKKGKSGGYRLIYWQVSKELVVLLDIYSKSDRADIDAASIHRIIEQFEAES